MPWVNADLWSAHTQQVKNATTILSTNPPADARDRRAHKWSGLFKFVLNAFRDEKEQIESSANVAMTATYVGRPHQSFRYVIWINLKRFLTLGIFSPRISQSLPAVPGSCHSAAGEQRSVNRDTHIVADLLVRITDLQHSGVWTGHTRYEIEECQV